MNKHYLMLITAFALSSAACSKNQKSFLLGDSIYQVPTEYLVISDSVFDTHSLDKDIGILGLTFNQDKDFLEFLGADAWLPHSSITAIMFSREGTQATGISPKFSGFVDFTIDEKTLVKFKNSYRLFTGNSHISWQAFPKHDTSFDGRAVKAKWVADCIPMGGAKGIEKSTDSIDIPTSCRINITYRNVILSLTTSERNLISNADRIVNLVLEKIDSWRVNN